MKVTLYKYDAIEGLDLKELFNKYMERYTVIMKELDSAPDEVSYEKADNAIKDLRQEICNYSLPVAVTWDMWLHKELNHNDVLVLDRTDHISEMHLKDIICCCLALPVKRILVSTIYNPIECLLGLQSLGCKCTETPLQLYHVNPQGVADRYGMMWMLPERIYLLEEEAN